jgi:hypothetical protein
MLRDLADHADFLRPYEFLERALSRQLIWPCGSLA